ncbi:hypothetical protein [Micromonospora sp. SH-82]|uniref:hypothetical protein n=1 Tax=Micromonospora sp. SH-82 TaxID=3132938 RepID=UPI003EBEF5A9
MIIERRYVGPPDSGNGGWSAGVFARVAGEGPVEVTLRRPPPLETPLTAVAEAAGATEIHDPEGLVVAEVRPVAAFAAAAGPVDGVRARAAASAYPGLVDHPFPGCYVCGPAHPEGLRIFPGRLPDGRTAAPWHVPTGVTDATVWAALDCPGGWAVIGPGRPYVLGRIATVLTGLPAPGDECVVTGLVEAASGRKAQVSSALYAPDGTLLGHARATWIALPAG